MTVEYRLKSDGTPLIHPWGCNRTDEGGLPRKHAMLGDVVWQYTLDPPLPEGAYKARP